MTINSFDYNQMFIISEPQVISDSILKDHRDSKRFYDIACDMLKQCTPDSLQYASINAKVQAIQQAMQILQDQSSAIDRISQPILDPVRAAQAHELWFSKTQDEMQADALLAYTSTLEDPQLEIFTEIQALYEKAALHYMRSGDVQRAFQVLHFVACDMPITKNHPLYNLGAAINSHHNRALDPQDHALDPQVGIHFSHMGTGALKGGHLRVVNRILNDQPIHRCDFTINHYARKELTHTLQTMREHLSELQNFLPPGCSSIEIEDVNDVFHLNKDGKFTDESVYAPREARAVAINFKGLGRVVIGNTPAYGNLYNQISVTVNASQQSGESLQQLHYMLSLLGCGQVLGVQSKIDNQRMQMAQLFRMFFPAEACTLERQQEFYEMPLNQLKQAMIAKAPSMGDIFKTIEAGDTIFKQEEQEIYPGKKVWCLNNFHKLVQGQGAWGLVSGVSGASFADVCQTFEHILKSGALSSRDRYLAGIGKPGASTEKDFLSGGGDQVFTRMIGDVFEDSEVSDFPGCEHHPDYGSLRILYDLSIIDRGCYAYLEDRYGVRNEQDKDFRHYANRDSMPAFAGRLDRGSWNNEVMIKNRMPPQYIVGVVVCKDEEKQSMIEHLRVKGLIEERDSQLFISGKPVDDFIHVSDKFTKQMWIRE